MSRPRGFIEWNPQQRTRALLAAARDIIEDVTPEIGAITLRQLFYLLVTRFEYSKTERAYKRLCEAMNRGRRAGFIDMGSIRDDGSTRLEPLSWESGEHFLETMANEAQRIRFDRQRGQSDRLIVWCETAGMAPQLERAVEEFGVPVLSSGGFDSLTFKHEIAREIAWRDEPTVILHVGDRDPSGEHVHMSLSEDLEAFVTSLGGGWDHVHLERIAVTDEQIDRLGLPTAPPKRTDRRSFDRIDTVQAEAIEPHELRRIVQGAVADYQDQDVQREVRAAEEETREALSTALKGIELPS